MGLPCAMTACLKQPPFQFLQHSFFPSMPIETQRPPASRGPVHQIIAFGCNILKEDDSILQAFLGSIFSQLCEFASEEVESALRQDRANLQFAALAPSPEDPIDLDP